MGAAHFGDFQPSERDLVLSILYRVGQWISHIDDVEGTARDDRREDMALEKVLTRVAGRTGKGSFVGAAASEILAHKNQWPEWDSMTTPVLDDVSRALRLVDDRLPKGEARGYRQSILHIAKAVAMAANESQSAHEDLTHIMPGSALLHRIGDWFAMKGNGAIPANISPAEKQALTQLLQRLKA